MAEFLMELLYFTMQSSNPPISSSLYTHTHPALQYQHHTQINPKPLQTNLANDSLSDELLTPINVQYRFTILFFNSRSLLSKMDDLLIFISLYSPAIICICETWLSPDLTDAELSINGYSLFRKDHNRHGEGITCIFLLLVSPHAYLATSLNSCIPSYIFLL